MAPANQQEPSQQQTKDSNEAISSKEHQDPASKEDQEECGWCRWMKAGGCKEQFDVGDHRASMLACSPYVINLEN
jgi:hypothetical protein